jgi:hypothetical protein
MSEPIVKKFKKKWKNSTKKNSKSIKRSFITKRKPKRSSETTLEERRHKGKKETAEPLRKLSDSSIVLLVIRRMARKGPFINIPNSNIQTCTNQKRIILRIKARTIQITQKTAERYPFTYQI